MQGTLSCAVFISIKPIAMLYIDNQASFFSVNHIIKPFSTKTIYGINFNNTTHFICKSTGVNDGEQLDNRPNLTLPL